MVDLISSMANFCPMQLREPEPNSKNKTRLRSLNDLQCYFTCAKRNVSIRVRLLGRCLDVKPFRDESEWIGPDFGITSHKVWSNDKTCAFRNQLSIWRESFVFMTLTDFVNSHLFPFLRLLFFRTREPTDEVEASLYKTTPNTLSHSALWNDKWINAIMIHNLHPQLHAGDCFQINSDDIANLVEAFLLHFLMLSKIVKRKSECTVCCVVTLAMKNFQVLSRTAAMKQVINKLQT